MTARLGLSGWLARAFIASPLTPLLLVAALAVGILGLVALPREEEPQISVPMVDIHVTANGLKADDAVELVTRPLESILRGIDGVEHVYSQTSDDQAMVTARFVVGTREDDAILRVHERVRANYSRMPIGVPEPLIVKRGINDVAVLTLTLHPKPEAASRWSDHDLGLLADRLHHELSKVENVGLTYIVGGAPDQIRVEPDPELLSLYGVTLKYLVEKVQSANRSFLAGQITQDNQSLSVAAGHTMQGIPDIGMLLLTTQDGRPVYVKDVARVVMGARTDEKRVWQMLPDGGKGFSRLPAVTMAFAKRQGANAVTVSKDLLAQLKIARAHVLPEDIEVAVTRNDGASALEKSNELLAHLAIAALSIAVLIAWALGWRAGVVVLVVVPVTILLTLFAAWLMGFTLNRVSLFALIFSIGILVDDAIVVIENITRHWSMPDGRTRMQAAIEAVAEVGNPTVVATLTVVAALLPMMFVSGLMGPYMSPIPANASAAMLFSFMVAVAVTPWLMVKLHGAGAKAGHEESDGGALGRLYRRVAGPVLASRKAARRFVWSVVGATVAACLLFPLGLVTVKLLPFDNKSEIQVVVDLPPSASLETTDRVLLAAAQALAGIQEITAIQAYIGTAAPFNFNGLVRHYYLRQQPHQGDLLINLKPKDVRHRSSHAIAQDIRSRLRDLALPQNARLRVAEVPPGPPVLATLLAEIYGPDAATREQTARKVRAAFSQVDAVKDLDDTLPSPGQRLRFVLDHDGLEFYGVEEGHVYDTLATLLGGVSVGYSHRGPQVHPIEIALRLPREALGSTERLLSTPVPAREGFVELGDVVHVSREAASVPIFRRDGRFAHMVMAELAGDYEAPIYAMRDVEKALGKQDWGAAGPPAIGLHGQPRDESKPFLLWDGEWEITYVTFRDMGAAFAVALLGIYLLVVAQFREFRLPLLVLVPVPLTLIGIVLGHALFGAPFTATSMIGFIALAGIIVRNSILLIDFIRHRQDSGQDLRDVLLQAGSVRFKPILLTALAAMIGAAFILADPIFQGLAISLLFGLASSTALTVLVIPAIYVMREPIHTEKAIMPIG
ncbi:MAG: efflux RND transporter permease subunit [Alphaproteobacteria bacterium]|nr:MAG: efflux RND transporter permease subunit [Alphaproteobacteria bacterium]